MRIAVRHLLGWKPPEFSGGKPETGSVHGGQKENKERGPSRGLGGRVKTPRDLPARLVPGAAGQTSRSPLHLPGSSQLMGALTGSWGGGGRSHLRPEGLPRTSRSPGWVLGNGPRRAKACAFQGRAGVRSPRLPRRPRPLEGFLQWTHPELRRYPIKLVEMRS